MRITAYLSYRRIRRYSVGRLKRLEARDFSHVRFTTSGLKIMDLNDYGILAWIAEVIANRGTSLESAEITGSRIVEMYRISTADFDIIKGYRADDSYTQVIEAFLLNHIYIE